MNPSQILKLPDIWGRPGGQVLRPHEVQDRLEADESRIVWIAAGRRSGKTMRGKRKIAREAIIFPYRRPDLSDGFFWIAGPTREQMKRIWWNDVKKHIPPGMIRRIYESDLIIALKSGIEIGVGSLDRPERMEGNPIDGIVIDEFANVKPDAWKNNIRPALDTDGREGWAWLMGVPEGRNHFYRGWKKGKTARNQASYHWRSDTVLKPEVIAAAKEELDERTFEQEYGASFLNFAGRIYYAYEEDRNLVVSGELPYDFRAPLILCFDFNVEPGGAVICQEGRDADHNKRSVTLVIDEVCIPVRSNTQLVCQIIAERYKDHAGYVMVYGDASGGASGSAKVDGSDWELVQRELRPIFGKRLRMRVPRANPREKERIVSMNTRLKPAFGPPRMLINGAKCPELVMDFEGVTSLPGTNGQIDKRKDLARTHWADGLGYYVHKKFPARTKKTATDEV